MDPSQVQSLDEPADPPEGCGFSAWLFSKQHEPSQVGQLAHVVARDPFWNGVRDRKDAVEHLTRMGANQNVVHLMGVAYDRYLTELAEAKRRAERKRARKTARASRKRNR